MSISNLAVKNNHIICCRCFTCQNEDMQLGNDNGNTVIDFNPAGCIMDFANCTVQNFNPPPAPSGEFDDLVVNNNLTGGANINLVNTLTSGATSTIESDDVSNGVLIQHLENNIYSFHIASSGATPHQANSGCQHQLNGNRAITNHTVDSLGNYDILNVCTQGVDTSDIEIAPTLIHLGSANLNAEITTKVTIDTPSIQIPQFINGVLKVDGTGNLSAGTLALSQLSDVIITGPTAQDQLVYDGAQWTNSQVSNTYSPVFGDFTNISAINLANSWYTIVGNVITVSITCFIDSVLVATQSSFSMTLPLNFSAPQASDYFVSGTCMQNTNPATCGVVFGFTGTNNKAQCTFTSIDTILAAASINFSYLLS